MTDDPTTGRAGDERRIGACEVCWTDSWAPVEQEADCALVHPHDREHVHCQYCAAMEQLLAARTALAEQERLFAGATDQLGASMLRAARAEAALAEAAAREGVMEAHARVLFDLLDDIDTASDMAKDDDKAYRAAVSGIQRRRFEVATTDGYTVTFLAEHDARRGEGER